MNIPSTVCVFVTLVVAFTSLQLNASPHKFNSKDHSVKANQLYVEGLKNLNLPIEIHLDKVLKRYLRSYTITGRREAEAMLGRSIHFLPLFEYYLKKHQLPDALKYLPILESKLKPSARSKAGAVGLWQFMPSTARRYGLRITKYVDERMDPHKSTEAAIKLLAKLYKKFGDWSLAVAAYNCGPGKVQRAIKMTGCEKFSDIAHLLPKQTRKYVPGLIAAAYIVNNYKEHQLTPKPTSAEPTTLVMVKLHDRLSFRRIAKVTKISKTWLRIWNPAYRQDVIPKSRRGNYLLIPSTIFLTLNNYAEKHLKNGLILSESETAERQAYWLPTVPFVQPNVEEETEMLFALAY